MNKIVEERTKRTQWYQEARFGMFIHWGLYAIPARGEWLRSVEQLPKEDYEPLKDEFAAENYNPKEWARLGKDGGCFCGRCETGEGSRNEVRRADRQAS